MDGSKKMGPKRQVQIDGSKYTGKNYGLKKFGQTCRLKYTGPFRGIQIKTEMSPKLKCPEN